MPTKSIHIIGGGPAGSSAAIRLARKGWNVQLFEKKRFPRAKLCGGFLSPEAIQDLDDFDVLDDLRTSAIPIRRTVIASPQRTVVETALPREALSVSRSIL